MNDERIYELAAHWFTGNATEAEKREIREWMAESEPHRREWSELNEIWYSASTADERLRYDAERAWQRFRQRHFQTAKPANTPRRNIRRLALKAWTLAASVMFPILLGITIFLARKVEPINSHEVAVSTISGESATFMLPDGTTVMLEENSNLTYDPNNFYKGERRIRFNGVAYFNVTKDKEHPFFISSSDIDVRVTGTAFNLKAGPNHKYDLLSLDEGSVEFIPHDSKRADILAPGDEIIFNKETRLSAIRHRDVYGAGVAHNLYEKNEAVVGANRISRGNGTLADPYVISNARQMLCMKEVLSAGRVTYFELENDIDMSNINWTPLNGPEDGFLNWIDFNGNNHVIRNFHTGDVRYKGINYYSSFFGVLCGACRNVGFENVDISSVGMGVGVLGGLIGYNTFPSTTVVENCYFTGHITTNADAGSIAGSVMGKTLIRNCFSNVNVTSMNSYAGGLVGRISSGLTIRDCMVGGSVSGVHAGGITAGGQDNHTTPSSFTNILVACHSIFGNKDIEPLGHFRSGDKQERLLLSPTTIVNGEQPATGCSTQQLQEFAASMRGVWYKEKLK
ncbi:MAG: FecR domain-containing protein [Bacteroidaceae bacterium]|nr:FecR domain-containing protein [Bacteroidaceae bacterium]